MHNALYKSQPLDVTPVLKKTISGATCYSFVAHTLRVTWTQAQFFYKFHAIYVHTHLVWKKKIAAIKDVINHVLNKSILGS